MCLCLAGRLVWIPESQTNRRQLTNSLEKIGLRGAFNKLQDYVLNTTTVNRTFLTVMLLFNIFSLQFTAMFPLQVGWNSIVA